jgi:hypothetical protein
VTIAAALCGKPRHARLLIDAPTGLQELRLVRRPIAGLVQTALWGAARRHIHEHQIRPQQPARDNA